jgi:hypothetical protein
MVELSWLTLSIGRSGLFGYNNGAKTTGTSSRGKSRRRLFRNVSFVSVTIPEKRKKKDNIYSCKHTFKYDILAFHFHLNRDAYYQTDPSVRKEDWSVSNAKLQELLRGALPPVGCCCSLLTRNSSHGTTPAFHMHKFHNVASHKIKIF